MKTKNLALWLALAVAAAFALQALLPRTFPLLASGWSVSHSEARELALEQLTQLGPLPEDPYVVTQVAGDPLVERRLLERLDSSPGEELADSPYLRQALGWQVVVYERDASPNEWSYEALISPQGEITALRRNLPPEATVGPLSEAEAGRRAAELLARSGFDLDQLEEPEVRVERQARRTDLDLRFEARERRLGDDVRYGVRVIFQGDQLGGFAPWVEDPEERAATQIFQQRIFIEFGLAILLVVLLPVLVVPFVRLYHAGEIGVRRATQIFGGVLLAGILAAVVSAREISQGTSLGLLPRPQVTLLIAMWVVAFMVLPSALMAAVAWSVGESQARQGLGAKLAAFDAVFRGQWQNATVATSSLRGVVLGLVLFAGQLALAQPLVARGFRAYSSFLVQHHWTSSWPGVAQLLWMAVYAMPALLLTCLLLPTSFRGRLGPRGSLALALALAWAFLPPSVLLLPLSGGVVLWLVGAAVPVLVFAMTDLWAALLCGLVARALPGVLSLSTTDDVWLQIQGGIPLLVLALPLLVSLRWIQSDERLEYRYDDVAPHVRRIAERERQRVELETAREIQASILPELPSQLCGVELAHVYQPATEVGGDFYDVLALEDGRLAVAVGDVAGHGVSSGLVMSMVKSALAVQVAFEPEVERVLTTLNRMVYQSARRRMLTTLSYALLDPSRRELVYASAGHIFPYRVTARGQAFELEAGEYPLGVRPAIQPRVRRERLEAGDYLVLLSDGVVERTPQGSTEAFGYVRLRDSLGRHAGGSPRDLVHGVLADLDRFAGDHPREDDLTILALRLPAA